MKVGTFVAGIILMILGVLFYFSMQTSMSDCGSFIGQLGRTFSGDIAQRCQMVSMMQIGAGIFVVIGLSLLIYGAVATGESRSRRFECKLCGSESDSLEGLRYHVEKYHKKKFTDSKSDDVKNIWILKERLAKGEITKEEYDELKKEFT
ncbi:MAG: SHOCT domain-containing protein [Thermoproteota archaeon]